MKKDIKEILRPKSDAEINEALEVLVKKFNGESALNILFILKKSNIRISAILKKLPFKKRIILRFVLYFSSKHRARFLLFFSLYFLICVFYIIYNLLIFPNSIFFPKIFDFSFTLFIFSSIIVFLNVLITNILNDKFYDYFDISTWSIR